MLYKTKQIFLLSTRTGEQLNVTFALESGQILFINGGSGDHSIPVPWELYTETF